MRNIVMLDTDTLLTLAENITKADLDQRTVRICTDTDSEGRRFIQWKVGEGLWTHPHYSMHDWNNPVDQERARAELNSREPMFEAIGERLVIVPVD